MMTIIHQQHLQQEGRGGKGGLQHLQQSGRGGERGGGPVAPAADRQAGGGEGGM